MQDNQQQSDSNLSLREKAIQFFENLEINNREKAATSPTYLFWAGDHIVNHAGHACHSCMMENFTDTKTYKISPMNARILASGFTLVPNTKEVGEKFWAWITGPESPWKSLFVNGIEPLYSKHNGFQTGWILPEETVVSADFRLMKNFCMATRTIYEKYAFIKAWNSFVEYGVNPAEAFILGTVFQEHDKGRLAINEINVNGWHWPISFRHLSISRFVNGNPDIGKKAGNDTLWAYTEFVNCYEKKVPDLINMGLLENLKKHAEPVSTKFSTTVNIELGRVVESFNEWKAKHET